MHHAGVLRSVSMVKSGAVSKAGGTAEFSRAENGDPPKLQGLDTNSQGEFGLRFWQSFRDSLAHLYTVSLADPLEEARFSLSSRTHPTLARS